MHVLFDEDLADINPNSLIAKTLELGLRPSSHWCKINRTKVNVEELSAWANSLKDKILLITNKKIERKELLDLQVAYSGVVDEIGGKIGVVKIDDVSKRLWEYIALHEIMHLYGVRHCETKGCIMSYVMCNCMLKYCVACETPCKELCICDTCRGVIDA